MYGAETELHCKSLKWTELEYSEKICIVGDTRHTNVPFSKDSNLAKRIRENNPGYYDLIDE